MLLQNATSGHKADLPSKQSYDCWGGGIIVTTYDGQGTLRALKYLFHSSWNFEQL